MDALCALFTLVPPSDEDMVTPSHVGHNITPASTSFGTPRNTDNTYMYNSNISLIERNVSTGQDDYNLEEQVVTSTRVIILISKIVIPVLCCVGVCGNVLNLIILVRRVSLRLYQTLFFFTLI